MRYSKRMMKTRVAIFLVLAAVTLLKPIALHACPGCTNSLNGSIGFGFNVSILFLMAMPFLVAASIAVGLIYIYRRAQMPSFHTTSSTTQITKQ